MYLITPCSSSGLGYKRAQAVPFLLPRTWSLFCASDAAFRKAQTVSRRRPEDKCKVGGKVTHVHTIEGGRGVSPLIPLSVTLDGGAWSASRPGLFSRGEKHPVPAEYDGAGGFGEKKLS